MTERLRRRLFALQDEKYRDFNSRLIPTVEYERIIGVRTPALRKLAKEAARMTEIGEFLQDLPHYYFEENNLHAFIIETIKDYDACVAAVDEFLPCVDNWATCDQLAPKVFGKHLDELRGEILRWLDSGETYTVRFAIGMLMRYYLEDAFEPGDLELVAGVRSKEYYVNMMIAWYFATALARQYGAALPYIRERRLDAWTHNKAIQKAVESRRISAETKEYLRTLKRRSGDDIS